MKYFCYFELCSRSFSYSYFCNASKVIRRLYYICICSHSLAAEVARSYPNDPNSRLNGYILNKLSSFLHTHFLRFKLIDSETMTEARSAVETGRKGKFGKKGGMEALIAAGLMMKGEH